MALQAMAAQAQAPKAMALTLKGRPTLGSTMHGPLQETGPGEDANGLERFRQALLDPASSVAHYGRRARRHGGRAPARMGLAACAARSGILPHLHSRCFVRRRVRRPRPRAFGHGGHRCPGRASHGQRHDDPARPDRGRGLRRGWYRRLLVRGTASPYQDAQPPQCAGLARSRGAFALRAGLRA